MAFDKIRQLMSDVQNALNPASKKEAINKASGYVDSVDSDLKALAAQNDINIFARVKILKIILYPQQE